MKKLTVLVLVLLLSVVSYSQQTEPSKSLSREQYLTRSKTRLITGSVLLGAGAITLLTISPSTPLTTVGVQAILGSAATLASIPFFISSGKNKRKARLMISSASLPGNQLNNNHKKLATAGIAIPFRN